MPKVPKKRQSTGKALMSFAKAVAPSKVKKIKQVSNMIGSITPKQLAEASVTQKKTLNPFVNVSKSKRIF